MDVLILADHDKGGVFEPPESAQAGGAQGSNVVRSASTAHVPSSVALSGPMGRVPGSALPSPSPSQHMELSLWNTSVPSLCERGEKFLAFNLSFWGFARRST